MKKKKYNGIKYFEIEKSWEERLCFNKVKNYRYVHKVPFQIFCQPANKAKGNIKGIKYLNSLEVLTSPFLPRSIPNIRTVKNMKLICHKDKSNPKKENEVYINVLLPKCKELRKLEANYLMDNLLTKRSFQSLQAVKKLEEITSSFIQNQSNGRRLKLFLDTGLQKVNFNLKLGQNIEAFCAIDFLDNLEKIGLTILHENYSLFPTFKDLDVLGKIQNFKVIDYSYSRFGDQLEAFLSEIVPYLVNLKSLSLNTFRMTSKGFASIITANLPQMKKLKIFDYIGYIHSSELGEFNFKILNEGLNILRLNIYDQEPKLFVEGIQRFDYLQELVLKFQSSEDANSIIQSLPFEMKNLRFAKIEFGSFQKLPKSQPLLKLELSFLLHWVGSLPKFEELSVTHPSISYFACHTLSNEGTKGSLQKLRKVEIFESDRIFRPILVQKNHQKRDLLALLKTLLSSNLEILIFPIHFETSDLEILDIVCENLLKCSRLKKLELLIWVNIINAEIMRRLRQFLGSLYAIKNKYCLVSYYESDLNIQVEEFPKSKYYKLVYLNARSQRNSRSDSMGTLSSDDMNNFQILRDFAGSDDFK